MEECYLELQPATLLNTTLLHFLKCTSSIKFRKTSHIRSEKFILRIIQMPKTRTFNGNRCEF